MIYELTDMLRNSLKRGADNFAENIKACGWQQGAWLTCIALTVLMGAAAMLLALGEPKDPDNIALLAGLKVAAAGAIGTAYLTAGMAKRFR